VFAPLWIRILFGPAFVDESVPILRILVLIIPLGIVGAVAGTWLMSLHMDRTLVRIVVGAGLVNVVFGCILTPLFGPEGMAWSVVIAQLAAATSGMVVVYRAERFSETPLLPWSQRAGAGAEARRARPEPGAG
jgi:O-antigen/teichoic acid export membrane protein